jgi:hypothetical protein
MNHRDRRAAWYCGLLVFGVSVGELPAQSSKVRIDWIGAGAERPTTPRCLPPGQTITPGDEFTVTFDARRVSPGTSIRGKIALLSGAESLFEVIGGNNVDVRFRFDRPSTPNTMRFRIRPVLAEQLTTATPRLQHLVQLQARDDDGVPSEIVSCSVDIERHSVALTDFRIQEAVNDQIEATVTIENRLLSPARNVPWVVRSAKPIVFTARNGRGGRVQAAFAQGVVRALGPLEVVSFTIPLKMTQVARSDTLTMLLDPNNTLGEGADQRADNTRRTGFPVVTRDLDPVLARAAGAQYSQNVQIEPHSCVKVGVGDWRGSFDNWAETPRETGVLFVADCGAAGVPLGVKADPEAYKGFLLKNGWKITAIEESEARPSDVAPWAGVFRWMTQPTVGSNNPYMQMHLAADHLQKIKRGVRIRISGPINRNPYR